MTAGLTDDQALCVALVASLALPFTLPSDRVTALAVLADHQASLTGDRFAALRLAVQSLQRAKTPLEWAFASHEATAALVPLFKAESCRLIAALAVRRVA